jgi:hypothetical protein
MVRLCGWLLLSGLLTLPGLARADSFDNYTNPLLAVVAKSANAEKLQKLTTDKMVEHTQVLPGVPGTFVVVKTNEGRWSKLLLQTARQKVSAEKSVPILLIERFVTFREGETRTIHASGHNVRLFADFRFSLDFGQVVPAELGGDIRFVSGKDGDSVEPVDKAEMYLVTKHLTEADPKRTSRPSVGATIEPHFFLGVYKLYDDGRRSGELHLKKINDKGEVTGVFYSDQGGKEYDVEGKVGVPSAHAIQFRVFYPQTFQAFQGFLFTGDGRVITGSSQLQQRETGFYAVRVEDEKK